jgi:hypothetical protein
VTTTVRIGNAQAFWGDRPAAAGELLARARDIDFLTMDYLAEVSMSILAIQRERDPTKGYAQDFVDVVRQLADYWSAGGKCRLIANAGGLNPLACAQACQEALEKRGCRSLKIGVVQGDNVIAILKASTDTKSYCNLDSGLPLSEVQSRLVTANAYLGCEGIVKALDAGADLVITGRVADPSMVVAAAVHAFGWKQDDWQALAGATIAGHLLECGTHVTGGISTDWLKISDPTHIGFPIAEISRDGLCVITKPPLTGGAITEETVKEQLIYEIGNPAKYISPDVIVSFLQLQVKEISPNRVAVSGAVGYPKPTQLKVSATYRDGYRAAGILTIFGPDAVSKARHCGEMVLRRLKEAGWVYRDTLVECLGTGDSVPVLPNWHRNENAYETVLRIAVEADNKNACEAFSKEMIPLVTAGPQGTTGYAEGRPNVHSIFRYWPTLIDTDSTRYEYELITTKDTNSSRESPAIWPPALLASAQSADPSSIAAGIENTVTNSPKSSLDGQPIKQLKDIAYGRSGDKGTGANIGILARTPEIYKALSQWLTEERVQEYFAPIGITAVQRFELENLDGFNFVLTGVLRRIIRNDAQGKALAQALLAIPLDDFPVPLS